MGLTLATSAAVLALAQVRNVELQRPRALATLLCLTFGAAGGLAAGAGGGLNGPLAFGLLPVVLLWPLLMPLGAAPALLPVLGAFALHGAVALAASSGAGLTAGGRAFAGFLAVLGALAIATAQVVEGWRWRAAESSQTDWLTQALSRPWLEERLQALCAQRSRSLAPVSLVMFDVDRFKGINDSHGRRAGDEVLELMVSGIKSEIRASDFLGRYGGDEFLLVLDDCEGNSAVKIIERMRERFAKKPFSIGEASIKLSFSAGIVSVPAGEALVLKDLLRNAERALEASRDSGRNRTSLAPPPPPLEVPTAPPPAPEDAVDIDLEPEGATEKSSA
jgi:diguanylate cyclase (GGDEF)-like protein